MAANIRLLNFRDATGGLNLRANQFTLGPNESPELLNVDVDPRGGFRLRAGVAPWGAADAGAAIHSLFQFRKTDGTAQLIAGWGNNVKYSTGGAWMTIKTDQTVSRPFSGVEYSDAAYIQNGTDQPIKWTGAVASRLTQTFNNTLGSGTLTGNMQVARCVAVFNNHVFAANTLETAVRYPHRVRWSHPGYPEAWRSEDNQDVEPGVNGDEIVGLAPFGDQLLVLKRNSIHVVAGYDWQSFQFDNVSAQVGAAGPKAWCVTPGGVFFWSWPEGLILYDGKGLQGFGDRLKPFTDQHEIDTARLDQVVLGYLSGRVYCSLPTSDGGFTTFVFDPTIGKSGAWVKYDIVGSDFVTWSPDAGGHGDLMANRGTGLVLRVDTLAQPYDVVTIGGSQDNIESFYTTPWFDAGEPAGKKRWRRPQIVYFVIGTGDVTVVTFYNYNAADPKRTSQQTLSATVEDALVWNVDDWDEAMWADQGSNHKIVRGSSLGTAHSIQMRFEGPPGPVVWGVDSISIPYIPRRIH